MIGGLRQWIVLGSECDVLKKTFTLFCSCNEAVTRSVKLKLNEWMYVICISYTYHSQQSLACSTQNMQAKSFAFGQLLEKGNYLVGSSSGAIYGKENTGIVLLTHFRNFIYCIIYIALAILESAHDKAIVVAMCMDNDAGLEKNLKLPSFVYVAIERD